MLNTTVGQLLINDVLPEELRDSHRVLDKKGLQSLLQQVAQQLSSIHWLTRNKKASGQ